jgi:hypothetical protein
VGSADVARKSRTVKVVSGLLLSLVAVRVFFWFRPWYFGLAAVVFLVSVSGSLLLLRGRARVVGVVGPTLVVAAAAGYMEWAGSYSVTVQNKSGQAIRGLVVIVDDRDALWGPLGPGQRRARSFVELGGPHMALVWWASPDGKPAVQSFPWGGNAAAGTPRTMYVVFVPGGGLECRFQ